ncbi:MAG: UDP-glucose/GDP-mannose dehydrogenase family protein [Candidatus Rickettsia vulgarisii]
MNITFIGAGYVGLVSGVMLSYLGHNVTCLDNDEAKIAKLKDGVLPIYEPELDKYLSTSVQSGKLKFTDTYNQELQNADAVFITVGTPPLPSGGANLSYIFSALDNLCKWLKNDCLIVIKSTVPPTTCNQVINYLKEKNYNFPVASNPEFLREGSAVYDFLNPDRILIGTNNKFAEDSLREIYQPLTSKNFNLVATDLVTSELSKYASNSFLTTKIAFINEMANLCEKTGANIKDLSFAMGLDKRIGKEFLNAGPGFGGSCFPKDLLALNQIAKNYQLDCKIVNSVIESNNQRPYDIVERIFHIIKNNSPKTLSFLGLTYKANTDDIRFSPAIGIIKILLDKGISINAYDPMGNNHTKKYLEDLNYKNINFADSAIMTCQNSSVIIIATEWQEFKDLDWEIISKQDKLPIIIDLRNILNPTKMKNLGFKYYCIGMADEM